MWHMSIFSRLSHDLPSALPLVLSWPTRKCRSPASCSSLIDTHYLVGFAIGRETLREEAERQVEVMALVMEEVEEALL